MSNNLTRHFEDQSAPAAESVMLYVGTHRRAHRADPADIAFGIQGFTSDSSGHLGPGGEVATTPQPGWIVLHPHLPVLYAANEVRAAEQASGISAFAIGAQSPGLAPLGSQPTPPMPCHCAVVAGGRLLLVATFGGGSIHLFPLDNHGAIGPECDSHVFAGSGTHPVRQTAPHAHAVAPVPHSDLVLVPDLGTDCVHVFRLDRTAQRLMALPEQTVRLPEQSGPRHIAFSADGQVGWLINEMSATVMTVTICHRSGALAIVQTVDLLPELHRGLRSGAAIEISRDGRHLYTTTRSHGSSGMPAAPGIDSVVWFAVAPDTGLLTLAGRMPSGGGIARSMALAPDGSALLVAHQCSGTIIRYPIDRQSGSPLAPGEATSTPVPVALAFYSANNHDRQNR